MYFPWLPEPLALHSSRDPGMCSMTPAQCAYKKRYWVFWYQADLRYGLPTVALFLVAILLFAAAHLLSTHVPRAWRTAPHWRRLVAASRWLAYKSWRLPGLRWNSHALGTLLLGGVGAVFFLAMTLGPQPYYWPNTRTVSYGNSPPIATRTGFMALACLPFVIAFGTKANFVTALTGISHERLNVWHNWASWAMFVLALIHTFPFIIFHIWKGDIVQTWQSDGLWLTGVLALLCQAWLTFMSIPAVRNRYYEFFKATHFFFAAAFILFFFFHCQATLSSWDYFIATAVLYALSWLYSVVRTLFQHGLHHRARIAFVAASDPAAAPHTLLRISVDTASPWTPGQHVFLRFLVLGPHALTSHPFTISSVARGTSSSSPSSMVFHVAPRRGLTGRLAALARKAPGAQLTVPVLIDGPYGGLPRRWFAPFDRRLVLAGGAGVGISLALVEHHLRTWLQTAPTDQPDQLQVVLATRDPDLRQWYLAELEEMLDVYGLRAASSAAADAEAEEKKKGEKKKAELPISVHIYETAIYETAKQTTTVQERRGSSHSSVELQPVKDAQQRQLLPKQPPNEQHDPSAAAAAEAFHVQIVSGERPDVASIVRALTVTTDTAGTAGTTVGVSVCGPSSMVHDAGVEAAAAQQRILRGHAQTASEVWYHAEAFSI